MTTTIIKPRKALNKAFLKVKPNREGIEIFKKYLIQLIDQIDEAESEEFLKNVISDFLKKTYYDTNHYINTKGRNDLVIHNGKDAKSTVGVIIEAKKPSNKSEMIKSGSINTKAFHELVLYYLRERVKNKNLEIKNLIITNVYEWYIFDVSVFENNFAQNKELVKKFIDFEEGRLGGTKTDFFYKEIAEPFMREISHDITYTHFDIRDYEKQLRDNDKQNDKQLISLFKLLSPEHLLKLPFANDSNTLDKAFYSELLHIIGLTETKDGGKKLIGRNKESDRISASLLENTIIQLESLDKMSRLDKPNQFGETYDERLFNVALELTITWVNRILFLKLLEAQLITYHKGDKSYSFLNRDRIRDFDDLNNLFFNVLAKKQHERKHDAVQLFSHVPYLNSSLFEPTELEHATLFINGLRDERKLSVISTSVLKDNTGKKRIGEIVTLEYFFEFLNAYDFASEGSEDIQEDNKTLINASVLGLIFEKINGYKDGSFFTPGFITMYMCRETIRRSVVQKFNQIKGWNCKEFDELYDKIEDREEANLIINSLKFCDPAVGSGHFLVSALNEIIAVKNDLRVLVDRNGKRLKEYQIEVVNDELIITDEDGNLFEYHPKNKESQRVQETLFHEKETIIESCLFGVDINPNSVKICRLRLWIELLKNAYYKSENELETLPNIDINIKHGNSLISRFPLDANLKKALTKKWTIDTYKLTVQSYRNAENKDQKREMERLINDIKSNFRSEISENSKELNDLRKWKGELFNLTKQTGLFEFSAKEKKEFEKKVKEFSDKITKQEILIEEIKNNKMYENAFEWRFEFPEVLNDDGDFVGFDGIIGNPPYIQLQKMGQASIDLEKIGYETYNKTGDIYSLFYEQGFKLLKNNGILTFITSNKWMRAAYGESLRKFFIEKTNPKILIDFGGKQVFDSATVDPNILIAEKAPNEYMTEACVLAEDFRLNNMSDYFRQSKSIQNDLKSEKGWVVLSTSENKIKRKIELLGIPLKDWDIKINYGIKTGFNEAFIISNEIREQILNNCPKADSIIRPILRGRDIKSYNIQFADQWIINSHNGSKNENIDPINIIRDYPSLYNHLATYEEALKKRLDKGNHWTNLRNCAYLADFEKEKIVWLELTDKPNFALDTNGYYINNTIFFMTGNHLKYLLAFLNSRLCEWYFDKIAATSGVGTRRWIKIYIDQICVPIPSIEDENIIIKLVDKMIQEQNKYVLKEIDICFYNAFKLTKQEIETIENSKL